MSNTIYLSVAALVYTILIGIIFLTKKKFKTTENIIYTKLIGITIVSLISELLIPIFSGMSDSFIFTLVMKLYLICCIIWISLFMEYTFIVSRNDDKSKNIQYGKKYKKLYIAFITITILIIMAVAFLPISFYNQGGAKYSYGQSVNLTFGVGGIYLLIIIFIVLKNRKFLSNKGYWPMIFLVISLTSVVIIQKTIPGLLLINSALALVTFTMYHTIENPDIKMVEELAKNRELIEKNIEEKSNFLFEISQDVKNPIHKIKDLSSSILSDENIDIIKDKAEIINNESKQLSLIVSNVLDVSTIDAKNIQINDNTFNPLSLFKTIEMKAKAEINEEVNFNVVISKSLPKELYGDSVKLKQILVSILDSCIKNTTEGVIEFKINCINKYDICRLIISVEDTGTNIPIEKINEILNNDEQLTEQEIQDLNKLDISLKLVNKIVKQIGGFIMIKSENKQGTLFTLILDQKIRVTNNDNNKPLEDMANEYLHRKKVIIVNDKAELIKKMTTLIKNYNVMTTMYGKDLIQRIENGEKYNLILLDDEMQPDSGYATLKELQKIKGFHTPVIILLNKDKMSIKEHYLKDGFVDYILVDNLNDEIKKIDNYI